MTKKNSNTILTALLTILLASCNKDEPKISTAQIAHAIDEMQGSYSGDMDVSYFQGKRIAKEVPCSMESTDSLTTNLNLDPMAMSITDEYIASILRSAGRISVKAGYEFYQMDDDIYHFILHPKDVYINTESDPNEPIRIVFAQTFGGCIYFYNQEASYTYNLSPVELWVGNNMYEDFKQLVFNCGGTRRSTQRIYP